MANIANSRLALGALLGTVASTANAVSDTVTGLGESAGMFNAAVRNARANQAVRHKLDQATFSKSYANQKALEIWKLEAQIKSEVGDNQAEQDSFNKILTDLEAVLK